MAVQPGPRYADPFYQVAHDECFRTPVVPGIPEALPPGVSREQFHKALDEIAAALGEHAVFRGERLKEYIDPYEIPEQGTRHIPGAAVCPTTVDELQTALKVVNKYKIPVWTISRGKNLGYGGPAPIVSGSIVMDMHRMNKILEVNEKFAYAVVEPGVSFADLYDYTIKNKLKLWPTTASLGWGSIVGNTLDRGMGFVPTGMHHENIAGLEVVLASGEVVRTGQFAMDNSVNQHLTHLSFGPTIDGLFLQSNLGIVTKLGLNLTPQPQAYISCVFDVPNFDDLAPLVDMFGAFKKNGTITGQACCFSIVEWSSLAKARHEYYDGPGAIPDSVLESMKQELDAGWWNVRFGLYGPLHVLEGQLAEIRRVSARQVPQGRLRHETFQAEAGGELLDATTIAEQHGGMFAGVPGMYSIPMVNFYNPKEGGGVGAHGSFSPIIPLDGATMLKWVKIARRVYEKHGMDLTCDFFMNRNHAVFVCMLCFDKMDTKMRQAIEDIFEELFAEGKQMGFAKYRAHINHMDQTADLFNFNNYAYRRFVQTIKDTVDPNGVLSPGKMGIWPQRFRELRAGGVKL